MPYGVQHRHQVTLLHCTLVINLTDRTYLIVEFYGIAQRPALALGEALPQSSILGRWVACFCGGVNQAVLWREVALRGEGRYDTSLKWHQFSWRQAALQSGRRIWQRRQTPRVQSTCSKKIMVHSRHLHSRRFASLYSPAMKSRA